MAAREKIQFTLWVGIIAVVFNIAGNLFLIPIMGISGATLASTISYSFVSLVVVYYLKETRLSWTALLPRLEDFSVYDQIYQRKAAPFVQKLVAYWTPSAR